ncbi:MAG TPA: YbaK/EbsC family protein [Pyrinomonadaceae bacterium]|jgi:prolyl-tRNA editing enzyme YbaK/EbsC (Cys-tRNA(Pro) deacylase)
MTDAEQKVIDALSKIAVAYELIEIDPAFSDTALFCERYGFPPEQTCNTILVTSKKGPRREAACVVLANTRLDVNRRVRKLLGASKASFASAEEMTALTGMEVGGVTPLALPLGLPLYVDERVMRHEWIILGGGGRSIKIKVAPEVLTKLGAEVVEDLAFEASAI